MRIFVIMRRFLASALIIWYGIFAVGLHIHVHYCCGQIANIAINTTAEACGSQCASKQHAAENTCSSSCRLHSHTSPETHQSTCCKSSPSQEPNESNYCAVERSCCSSDDFHLSIDEAHAKSSLEFNFTPAIAEKTLIAVADLASQTATTDYYPAPRDGIPLYRLYQQPRHYL